MNTARALSERLGVGSRKGKGREGKGFFGGVRVLRLNENEGIDEILMEIE